MFVVIVLLNMKFSLIVKRQSVQFFPTITINSMLYHLSTWMA